MRTLRLIAVFILFALLMGAAQGQTLTENKVKIGAEPIWVIPDIDSAETITATTPFDIGLFKGNTMYYAALYDGGANDSVMVELLGKLTNSSSETITDVPIDTIYLKSDTKYILATSWSGSFDWVYPRVSAFNGVDQATNKDGDVTDNGTLRLGIIGTQNANLNTVRSWWQNK